MAGEAEITGSNRALRLLGAASAPTFHLLAQVVLSEQFLQGYGDSHFEWKGWARYWSMRVASRIDTCRCRTTYPGSIRIHDGYFAFNPQHWECFASHEQIRLQPVGFMRGGLQMNCQRYSRKRARVGGEKIGNWP